MESEEDFHEYLLTLNSESCLEKQDEALSVISSVQDYLTSDVSKLSFQLYSALLLDEQTGVIAFIRKTAAKGTEFQRPIGEAFTLIQFLIKNYQKLVEPSISNIINLCLYIVKIQTIAAVRIKALQTTQYGISTCVSNPLDINKLVLCFQDTLIKQKANSPSVVSEIYSVLGVILKEYPEVGGNYKDWFLKRALKSLTDTETAHKNSPTVELITGCFNGLCGYFNFFSTSEEQLDIIYKHLKIFCTELNSKKHVVNRSALDCFREHCRKFSGRIYRDEFFWSENLKKWLELPNSEDYRAGFSALIAFYREIARYLEKERPENGNIIFNKYLKIFTEGLKCSRSSAYLFRASLGGIGELCSSYSIYSTEKEISDAFENIMNKARNIKPHTNVLFFSGYLESISKYISALPGLKIDQLNHLQRLSVVLIENFPDIDLDFQEISLQALEQSFYCVNSCGLQVLENHVKNVIYQGMIRTCARPILIDVELKKEIGLEDLKSYKSYTKLWIYLLNLSGSKIEVSNDTRRNISVKVYDAFISSFLSIVNKLNLDIYQAHLELSDPEFAMQAKRPRDFEIFINAVDLFQELIPNTDSSCIRKWFNNMLKEMIDLSYKRPLVSGFYKIVSTILPLAKEFDIFCSDSDLFKTTVKYLEDILIKVDQYKGDLQIACLRVILSAPVRLVEDMVERSVPAFEVILRVGRGYLPLLQQSIDTLHRWNSELPNDITKPFFQRILPKFEIFLQSEGTRYLGTAEVQKSKSLKSGGKIKKVLKVDSSDGELILLQRSFLRFLGTVSQDVAVSLVKVEEDEERKIDGERLLYVIPFTDGKPKLSLDELLPRIIELSMSCSDRSTRVTACELLHAVTLVALGNIKEKQGRLTGLFRKLLQVCLVLSCDSDPVVQQLFNPLTLQMTHYFSSKIQLSSQESATLIEVLMDNVSHPYDSAIRDFAARSIREFIEWSIKQLSVHELEKSDQNIRAILRMIFSFALHPSYNKRLGAAIAFNSIYTNIRNEKSLLDKYWFEIYYYFIECLKMSDSSEDTRQILNAIKHVKRPLLERPEDFNVESDSRKIPPGFESGLLRDLVKWTFARCSSTHRTLRLVAMECVTELAPKVTHCKSLRDFVYSHVPDVNRVHANDSDFWSRKQAQFDYYVWLLREDVADVRKINFDIAQEYVDRLEQEPEGYKVVVSFLEFLEHVVSKDHEKAIDVRFWKVIRKCTFASKNVDVDHDKLNHVLNRFFLLPVSVEPLLRLSKIERPQVSNPDPDLLNGLMIMEKSGRWNVVNSITGNAITGEGILKEVFNSLFEFKEKKVYTVERDFNFSEKLLSFGLKLDVTTKSVVECVSDEDIIAISDSCEETTKGEYFLKSFQNLILDFLSQKIGDIEINGKNYEIFIPLLDHMYRLEESEKTLRVRKNATRKIYDNWSYFLSINYDNSKNEKEFLMNLVKKTVYNDSPGCLTDEKPIGNWVCGLLSEAAAGSSDVEFVLSLLPYLSKREEEFNMFLKNALGAFKNSYPLFACDVKKNTPELANLTVLYENLLSAFQETGSLVILEFILSVFPRHEHLLQEELATKTFENFAKTFSYEHVVKAMNLLFKVTFEDSHITKLTNFKKRITAGNFLSVVLKNVTHPTYFIRLRIQSLCYEILNNFEARIVAEAKVEFAKKTAAAKLIEVIHVRMSREKMDGIFVELKELRAMLHKATNEFSDMKIKPTIHSPEINDLQRVYACACFNALCVIITERCDQPQPYEKLLFNDIFWSRILDPDQKFNLSMDFDEVPKRRKVLTSLRNTITRENQQETGATLRSLKYVQTQTIFESTLKEDVTKFDFTHASVRPISSVENIETTDRTFQIDMEMDEINDNESMAYIIAVVCFMSDKKIGSEDPCWLKSILKKIGNSQENENVRIFALKVLCNVEAFARPFAKKVIPVVIEAVYNLFRDAPINYFLMDVVMVLVNWRCSLDVDLDFKVTLMRFVKNLIPKIDACRKDIVKNNLELVKLLVEVWKNNLDFDDLSQFVYNRMDIVDNKEINFQVAGILLVNGIPPWVKGKEQDFMEKVLSLFKRDTKQILAAEVVGMSLSLAEKLTPHFPAVYQAVLSRISDLYHADGKNVLFLHAIQKHYPKIASEFASEVKSVAWTAKGSEEAMEVILTHSSMIDHLENDNFALCIDQFLKDMMNNHDVGIKVLALRILRNLIDKMDVNKIVDDVTQLRLSKFPEVRRAVYEICMWLYDNSDDLYFTNDGVKTTLVKGLTDSNEELQRMCLDFWSQGRIDAKGVERISYIFTELYSKETEAGFLSYATRLLLDATKASIDYKEPIFSSPILSCDFRDVNVVATWRAQHFTIAPMFAPSIASQLVKPETISSEDDIKLRATLQTLLFTPTIAESSLSVASESNAMGTYVEAKPSTASAPPGPIFDQDGFKVPSNFRTLRGKKQQSSYFARREIKRKRDFIEKEEERIKKRSSEVAMYRQYRSGDYPDIQISHSHILTPLEILAKKDSQIARLFLVSLHDAMIKYLKQNSDELIRKTETFIHNLIQPGESCDPAVLAFAFHVALRNDGYQLDSSCIKIAAKSSGWLSLGALIIENGLISKSEDEISEPKRRRGETTEAGDWLHLADLYRSLKEFDVVRGIFLDKITVRKKVDDAIRSEAVSDWVAAANSYQDILNEESARQTEISDFYAQAYFSCLANLSNWDQLNEVIRDIVNNDPEELWKDTYGFESFLPWFFKSQMMISLSGDSTDFVKLVDTYCSDKNRNSIMGQRFSEVLAVSYYLSRKAQKSFFYADQLYAQFLQVWPQYSKWSGKLRTERILNLQVISEIDQLSSLLNSKPSEADSKVGTLLNNWKKDLPKSRDDMLLWETKISYRKLLLRDYPDLKPAICEMDLAFIKAALKQDNYYLAKKYIKVVENMLDDYSLKLQLRHLKNASNVVGGKLFERKPDKALIQCAKTWHNISANLRMDMDTDSEAQTLFVFKSNLLIAQVISQLIPKLDNAEPTSLERIILMASLPLDSSAQDVSDALKLRGIEILDKAKSLIEPLEGYEKQKAKTYMRLAVFYKTFMPEDTENCRNFLFNVLRAMRLGDVEARSLFGCVLTMPEVVDGPLEQVLAECDSVPVWMFLTWMNQMLASLDTQAFPILRGILARIAEEYPNAIRHAFRLSKDNYDSFKQFGCQRFVGELSERLLNDRLQEQFLTSLTYVGPPDLMLTYYLEKILSELYAEQTDWDVVEKYHDTMVSHLYSEDVVPRGDIFKRIAVFEGDMRSLQGMRDKDIWKREIRSNLEKIGSVNKELKNILKSYSPWLDEFQSLNYDDKLEVPGHYDGTRKPNLKYHATIASFKSDLLRLKSKTRPLRLTILGNDAVEYKFMVKFGEDLRQDQRIEQLFCHVNKMLRGDKNSESIYVDTYNVIPLTSSLGLIQWVDDSVSLRDMVVDGLREGEAAYKELQSEYCKFFTRGRNNKQIVEFQKEAYLYVNRAEAVNHYNSRIHAVPRDILRRAFWRLSTSPEHFIYLRGNFATSQAALFVTHWILGIGDRHLQNTLISRRTGRALGIDFGYAFGFATQYLPLPELVPFRLTPVITNLLRPLEESGWIKQSMIHCLRALRRDPTVFLAILDIFVLEPSLEWLEQARKRATEEGNSLFDSSWYPKQKTLAVKEKLRGSNPVVAFRSDLKGNKQLRESLKDKCIEVLEGIPEANVRKRCESYLLTVEQQVDCLIDLATDPHVLSKTYFGWAPWI